MLLIACTPETDLRQVQASGAPAEDTADPLSSTPPDPLAGQLVEPPDGTTGIAPNLAALVVRFTEAVQPSGPAPPFVLRAPTGAEVPLVLGDDIPCARTCYQLAVPLELAPLTVQTLEVGPGLLQFLDGKPVPGGSAGAFTTSDAADRFAPRVQALEVAASEGCLAVRLTADESVRAEVLVTDGVTTVTLPSSDFGGEVELARRLPTPSPGPIAEVAVRVYDRAGNVGEPPPVSVSLPLALPQLVISELLPNPAGSETTQEFVEIHNAGASAVAMGGLVIADKTGADALPEATLAPGAFAVVVAEKYDAAAGTDVPPIATASLLRVAGRIGSDGIANAGETIELRTALGDVISRYGGWVDTSASAWSGKAVRRVSFDACDGAAAWVANPAPATPGW